MSTPPKKSSPPNERVAKENAKPAPNPQAAMRKLEIIGILVLAISILIGISIITYNAADHNIVKGLSISEYFAEDSPARRIRNGLGPVGTWMAHLFVYLGFGYCSSILAFLVGKYGWTTFRQKKWTDLPWVSGYLFTGMVLVATDLGWISLVSETTFIAWYGMAGLALARVVLLLLATWGSAVVLFAFNLIFILAGIDQDIQVTVDRFIAQWHRFRNWLAQYFARLRQSKLKVEEQADEAELEEAYEEPVEEEEEQAKPIVPVSGKPAKAGGFQVKPAPAPVPEPSPAPPVPQIDTESILRASIEAERKRMEQERLAEETDQLGKRVRLEPAPKPEPDPDLDDVEMKVEVPEEDEQAGRGALEAAQEASKPVIREITYRFPTIDLLDQPPTEGRQVDMEEINTKKRIILEKLKIHGIDIIAINAIVGPTVTLYELTPAPDVKINRIESYANDLKMAMEAHGIRTIIPIPGKNAVGIEVPNAKRDVVFMRQMINSKKFVETDMRLPVAFGKTIENETFMIDLTKMPHLLIAGATGSGKSVGINTILTCLLYKCHPDNLKFVLVDPKKIELSLYQAISRHFLATLPHFEEPIITDTSKVLEILLSTCKEMDDRYDLLKAAMVRDIVAYNEKFAKGALDPAEGHRHLPYIVVIIDELADLMITAGKQIEEPIARLAQLARAIGIHLVVATQRPSVNVITGTIKANFPSRIAYQVASKIDSRTILDQMGAEQLVGRGDMLFSGGSVMVRVQNAFVSTEDVERLTNFIGNQIGYDHPFYLPVIEQEGDEQAQTHELDDLDDMFVEAAKTVVLHQQGSVSLLQRKLKLGYNRAGRIIDQLYAVGVIGPHQGSTAREVLIETEEGLMELLRERGIS
jgi:S-DNA-T family DNA segregation ATPase FtsK/SpoIIIE